MKMYFASLNLDKIPLTRRMPGGFWDDKMAETTILGEITVLLRAIRAGDRVAEEALMEKLYPELHRIARALMQREREGHTLQTTALVNEAYLRLAAVPSVDIQDRTHFFAVAARVMRRILIDHARRRS